MAPEPTQGLVCCAQYIFSIRSGVGTSLRKARHANEKRSEASHQLEITKKRSNDSGTSRGTFYTSKTKKHHKYECTYTYKHTSIHENTHEHRSNPSRRHNENENNKSNKQNKVKPFKKEIYIIVQ